MRAERLANGDGISLFAALWLAVLASLLPSGTVQEGPPSYKRKPFLCPSNRIEQVQLSSVKDEYQNSYIIYATYKLTARNYITSLIVAWIALFNIRKKSNRFKSMETF